MQPVGSKAAAWPRQWHDPSGKRLDWRTIVQISRPGWWLVHVWLYLAPTGQKYELLQSGVFWLGLLYALFPLNVLVYGMNDYTDVDLDRDNKRKGNFLYGAKCTKEQLRDLPVIIIALNVIGIMVLAVATGKYMALSLWLIICFVVNGSYNLEPLRLSSKGPFELPCVVFGFSGVTALASIVNDIPWAPFRYWLHMSCLVLRTQLWTEFLDYDPDLACGRRTTSTLVGRTWSQVLTVLFLIGEFLTTVIFFDDLVFQLFSVSGIVLFVALEVIRGTSDAEKKKAMKVQNAIGLSLVFWIWSKGLFAA